MFELNVHWILNPPSPCNIYLKFDFNDMRYKLELRKLHNKLATRKHKICGMISSLELTNHGGLNLQNMVAEGAIWFQID